jgi:hypothetical protein
MREFHDAVCSLPAVLVMPPSINCILVLSAS